MAAVGIDIAKHTFDIALTLGGDKYRTRAKIANTASGHAQCLQWLRTHAPGVAVFMEATGVYHEALAEYLVAHGITVYVYNPAQVAAFARSELARTKTDRTDAKLIARFGVSQLGSGRVLRPWAPLPPSQKRLKALVARLDDLQGMRQMEANRLDVATADVSASIAQLIAALDAQIKATKAQIRKHINDDPDLRGDRDLLLSIPGIADTTVAWLLACLGDTRQFEEAADVVAYVGLNPRLVESGQYKGHVRISKVGSARLRAKLYMPAMVSRQHNPVIRAFCERLLARGKNKKLVVIAAMRKLLHIVWGVLKNRTPFDPNIGVAEG